MSESTLKRYLVFPLILWSIGCGNHSDDPLDSSEGPSDDATIADHVPPNERFDSLLVRDLGKYFLHRYPGANRVTWEYLREGPTQSGNFLPKYYLWVTAANDTKVVSEGAVRLAVLEREGFQITHYEPAEMIRRGTVDLGGVFPGPVCEGIQAKLDNRGP